jgi:hypothetical protein
MKAEEKAHRINQRDSGPTYLCLMWCGWIIMIGGLAACVMAWPAAPTSTYSSYGYSREIVGDLTPAMFVIPLSFFLSGIFAGAIMFALAAILRRVNDLLWTSSPPQDRIAFFELADDYDYSAQAKGTDQTSDDAEPNKV